MNNLFPLDSVIMPPKLSSPNPGLNVQEVKSLCLENRNSYRTKVHTARLQLQAILEKNLQSRPSHEQANKIYSIHRLLTKIDLLNLDQENSQNLRKMLDDLSELTTLLVPSMRSKILGNNPRQEIKTLLEKNQEGAKLRPDIDPKITAYIAAQRAAVAHEIAYRNALQQVDYLQRIQAKYPEDTLEPLILKRHEVSSNTHKGVGFNPDTGLDALHFPLTRQTLFDLESAQKVQTMQLLYMKTMGAIGHVDLMVSPVQRSYETALHATFELKAVDTVFISSVFAEKQHAIPLIGFSARASKKPSEVASLFAQGLECKEALPFENEARSRLSFADDHLINYEYPWKFNDRVRKAYAYTTLPCLHKADAAGASLRILTAHGGLNKALLRYIKKINSDIAGTIPEHLDHLDYGSQYQLVLVRDKHNAIKAIEYIGIYNRFGAVQIPTSRPVMLEDRLAKLLMHIDTQSMDGEALKAIELAQVLFKYCLLEPQDSKARLKILEKNHANIMMDHLRYIHFKDLERSQFLIETLLQCEFIHLNRKMNQQSSASTLTLLGIAAVHQLTGKDYSKQIAFLNQLKKEGQFVDIATLKNLLEKAKETFTAGKVTHLIEAVLRLQEERQGVQEQNQANAPS